MAGTDKNLAERSVRDYKIDPATAAMLSRYPYKHSNIDNFGLAYQALNVKNLVINSTSLIGLEKIAQRFQDDFDILCNDLNISGSTSARVASLREDIFQGINNYNIDIPKQIGQQAQDLLNNVDWRKFLLNEFQTVFLSDRRTLTTYKGEKIPYSKILSMTETEEQLEIFPPEGRKAFMQRLVTALESSDYLTNAHIPVEEARQVFYGIRNSDMGILLLSKAYRRLQKQKNVKKVFLKSMVEDAVQSIENNIRKNKKLYQMLSGAKSEQELEQSLNRLTISTKNIKAEVSGSKKSENYSGTNKIDILLKINTDAFGIGSKNLRATNDGKWLLGTFHQAASTASLLDFLQNNIKIQVTDGNIILNRLLIYLIANVNINQSPKNFKKSDVREDIANIAKLYLSAFIGEEAFKNLDGNGPRDITNSIIVSVPQQVVIPTFVILRSIINDLKVGQATIGSLSGKNTKLFDIQVDYVKNDEDASSAQTARFQKRNILKEMPPIQGGELKYDNPNLLAIGQQRALSAVTGRSLAVKINFLANSLQYHGFAI